MTKMIEVIDEDFEVEVLDARSLFLLISGRCGVHHVVRWLLYLKS